MKWPAHAAIAVVVASVLAACSSSPARPPVDQPKARVLELAWTVPTEAEDGAAVDDLAGFRVEYGSGQELQRLELGPDVTTHRLTLQPGEWFFRVVAVSASRGESPASNLVTRTLR